MRPADGGKQQRIRLRGHDAVKAWVDGRAISDPLRYACALARA